MKYIIYDKKCVQKKGLDKCILRTASTKHNAKVYTSNNPEAYIVKKISEKRYKKEMLK